MRLVAPTLQELNGKWFRRVRHHGMNFLAAQLEHPSSKERNTGKSWVGKLGPKESRPHITHPTGLGHFKQTWHVFCCIVARGSWICLHPWAQLERANVEHCWQGWLSEPHGGEGSWPMDPKGPMVSLRVCWQHSSVHDYWGFILPSIFWIISCSMEIHINH